MRWNDNRREKREEKKENEKNLIRFMEQKKVHVYNEEAFNGNCTSVLYINAAVYVYIYAFEMRFCVSLNGLVDKLNNFSRFLF